MKDETWHPWRLICNLWNLHRFRDFGYWAAKPSKISVLVRSTLRWCRKFSWWTLQCILSETRFSQTSQASHDYGFGDSVNISGIHWSHPAAEIKVSPRKACITLLQNGRKSGLPENEGILWEIHERVHVENLRPRAVAYNKRVMESRSLTTQIHWSNLNPIKT